MRAYYWPRPVLHQNPGIVYAMLGYHSSVSRQQSLRLLPLLVLASIMMTLLVTIAEAQIAGPEIITYGECPSKGGQPYPYRIQTPLPPSASKSSPSNAHDNPLGRNPLQYNIDGVADPYNPTYCGSHLPVSIQSPVMSPPPKAPPVYRDPLRGKSYGIGIDPQPTNAQIPPSMGQYNFGVQNPVPGVKRQPTPAGNQPDPYAVQIQPGANPNQGSPLWDPMPVGIQHPAQSPNGPGGPGVSGGPAAPPPRLTGLTSAIDKLLLPAHCPVPMDGQGNGPSGGGYPGGSGPYGGGGPFGGGVPLGGGGYTGAGGPFAGGPPFGGGGYTGGGVPLGGGGYTGAGGPFAGGPPFGGGGYPGAGVPLGGGGYTGAGGPSGSFSSCK